MKRILLIVCLLPVSLQTNAQIKETLINASFEDSLNWLVTSTCEEQWELKTGEEAADGKNFIEFHSSQAPEQCHTVLQSDPVSVEDFHFYDSLLLNFHFYRSEGKSEEIDFMAVYLCDTFGNRIKSTQIARQFQEYEPVESGPGWHSYSWTIDVEELLNTPFDNFVVAFIGFSGGRGEDMRLDGVVLSGN